MSITKSRRARLARIFLVGVVAGAVAPSLFTGGGSTRVVDDVSQIQLADDQLRAFIQERYPAWRSASRGLCPAHIEELTKSPQDILDPWGRDYRFHCAPQKDGLPLLTVRSAGPDRVLGTRDDRGYIWDLNALTSLRDAE